MNSILIVLPILTLLMFELGLVVKPQDFKLFIKRPKPVIAGLIGQILFLPAIAFAVAFLFDLEPLFFIGLILIACSPGGSSSNVFSMLAKGDVALSVSLTALSSMITLFTIPLVLSLALSALPSLEMAGNVAIKLPVGHLIIQNILLMLLPVVIGILVRQYRPRFADRAHKFLSKVAFPALLTLAVLFFVQHHQVITSQFGKLGMSVSLLILLAMGGGYLISKLWHLDKSEEKTLIIEIGMQNAAQSIAIASSPFVFNNSAIAVPAIIYALMMNIILLVYILFAGRMLKIFSPK